MDFNKIKDFAKKATEKTADGLSSMNEMRKRLLKRQRFHSGRLRSGRRLMVYIILVSIQKPQNYSNLRISNLRALQS